MSKYIRIYQNKSEYVRIYQNMNVFWEDLIMWDRSQNN